MRAEQVFEVGSKHQVLKRRAERLVSASLPRSVNAVRASGVLFIALIAYIDWHSASDIPLGFLYLLPMLLLGRVLQPWQSLVAAACCTYLTERFDPFTWNLRTGVTRDSLYFIAFFSIALFVYHSARNREIVAQHVREIESQSLARLQAEQQLSALIQTSPAAILTTDLEGKILSANHAAHELLAVPEQTLESRNLSTYFPALRGVLYRSQTRRSMRTVMQARGLRESGEALLAEICFSSYDTAAGPRFTAMVLDASDEFRTREESSLRQILACSRLAVSAMSHEMRNISGAIGAVHRNICGREFVEDDPDFEALGNLVIALQKLAALDLRTPESQLSRVDLVSLFEDLKIVMAPDLEEFGIRCSWTVDAAVSPVWADPADLLQVFLNLLNNSVRALTTHDGEKRLEVLVREEPQSVRILVTDTGTGVERPEKLFHPFQAGAKEVGLGLFLARAFMRSFGGDLQYQAVPRGACFVVTLERAAL